METARPDELSGDLSPNQNSSVAKSDGSDSPQATKERVASVPNQKAEGPTDSPQRAEEPKKDSKPTSVQEYLQQLQIPRIAAARYDPKSSYPPRQWVIEGLVPLGSVSGYIGPEKAEKSIMALRLAMHIACGKNFFGFRVPKSRPVVYFNAEDPSDEINKRYKAMRPHFSPEEQALIEKNLVIVKGRELIHQGTNIEIDSSIFWGAFRKVYPAEVYILDAFQMFHSANIISNSAIKDVLLRLRSYCGPQNCLIILHHTRKREDREVTRKRPVRLRDIGARIWSDKALGAGVFKRFMDVIICQEYVEERNRQREVTDTWIDFSAFGRVIEDVPVLEFRCDGDYWHQLVEELSGSVQDSYCKLRSAGGPWPSKNAAAKVLGLSRSTANIHVNQLIIKGYLKVCPGDGSVCLAL